MRWTTFGAPRATRGARLRQALEDLGPIFVKFGQVLSTRRDLLPPDVADELAKLQDRVPPFRVRRGACARSSAGSGVRIDDVFTNFEDEPVASASIAQVHFAVLKDGPHAGKEVAVKVLRPNMLSAIDKDLSLLETGATLVEKLWRDGKRLRPRDVVREFDTYLHDELDLMREAANASQLRRNFAGSPLLVVPEMYFDYCSDNVLVMERMHGIPVSQIERLKRGRHRPEEAVARRRDAVLHAGVRPRVLPRRHAPRQHPGRHQRRPVQQVHRARLRHRRHADRDRQELPRAELPRVLPARLQAHRRAARRIRLGAGGHAHQRTGRRGARRPASRCSTSR